MPYRDPATQREHTRQAVARHRAATKGKTVLKTRPNSDPTLAALRCATIEGILAELEEQLIAVKGDGAVGTVERARCVGFLLGVALRCVEQRDIVARLEQLETIFEQRANGSRGVH